MNYLWGGMILVGILYGICTGNISQVTDAILDSGKEAVNLSLSMAGVIALWSGIMRIAQEAGLIQKMAEKPRFFNHKSKKTTKMSKGSYIAKAV